MKNITKYLISGMVGLGSLVLGNNGYGQEDNNGKSDKIEIKKLCILDENKDEKIDKIILWFNYSGLMSLTYFDEDFNGEIDSYHVQIHNPDKTLNWEKDKINNYKENIIRHKKLLASFKKFSPEEYCLNKKGVCDKNNLLDCLIELF